MMRPERCDDMTMQRATDIAVTTKSTEPMRAILEIDCAGSLAKFEINEDLAHRLCSELERFLTQVPCRTRAAAALIEQRAYKPTMQRERAYDILLDIKGKLERPLVLAFREVAPKR
ncbi:hypothetical protein IC762_16300 [Bradyrhizobium genosp. L]|uniref:hypothetical protein n=1 Tax=Bradyrhizobium genosp. L TaxID=83637 RepID=UPI0018A3203C|nr:hypothetical protein [Bradyrhizobium genosp. L]QPF87756.1 hypothetical protein IC762_16300 [Bradyrhizobium genosp. L]